MFVELIEDDICVGVSADLHDDAHTFPVRLVPQISDAIYFFIFYQLGDLFDETGLVYQKGNLRDHDLAFAVGHGLNVRHGPNSYLSSSGSVGFLDSPLSKDGGSCGEIRTFYDLHDLFNGGFPLLVYLIVDDLYHGGNDFPQVVGRYVGGHAYGDAGGTIYQKVGVAGRENRRLFFRLVKVWHKVHGVFADVG